MIGPKLPAGLKQAGHGGSPESPSLVSLVSVTDLPFMVKTDMGAGLQNLGNSCYMNSVLQCLAYLPPVTSAVQQQHLHGFVCQCPVKGRGAPCTACLVEQQLLSQLNHVTGRAVRPDALHSKLQLFSKGFVRGRQEDAHEFLLAVMDAVERDSRKGLIALRHPKATRTFVEQLFCGRLQSQVRCLECGYCSNTYETLTSLSLDLQRISSVEQSMAQYTASELLDGANKYKCDKCQRLVRARKSLGVYDEPNVLVIHLKRFDAFSFSAKVCKHIEFKHTLTLPDPPSPGPTASVSMPANGNGANGTHGPAHSNGGRPGYGSAPANGHGANGHTGHSGPARSLSSPGAGAAGSGAGHSGQPDKAMYMLTGVLVHSGGSVHSGHYYAYVRNSSGKWFCANDSAVYPVPTSEVLQQQAYLLFYSRTRLKALAHLPDAPPAAVAAPAIPAIPAGAAPALVKAPSNGVPLPTVRSQSLPTAHSQPLATARPLSGTPTASPRAPIGPERPPAHLIQHRNPPQVPPSRTASGSWTTVQPDKPPPAPPSRLGSMGSGSMPQSSHTLAPSDSQPPAKAHTTTLTGLSGNVSRIVLKPKAHPGAKPPSQPWSPEAAHALLARSNRVPSDHVAPSKNLQRELSQPEPLKQQQQPPSGDGPGEAPDSRKRPRPPPGTDAQPAEAEQGDSKRAARSSLYAEKQDHPALREALHHAHDQLITSLSAAAGCRDELRALCMRLKQQGMDLTEVLAQDCAGRQAIVRGWLQGEGGPVMLDLTEQLKGVVRAHPEAAAKPSKA